MQYEITKKEIIEAILTEPLRFDTWVDGWAGNKKNCSVCAVGAVLRKVGLNNDEISLGAHSATKEIYSHIDIDSVFNGNFLSVLSVFHEYYATKYNSTGYSRIKNPTEQRFFLLNVIEAFCPDVVTFEVENV